MLSKLISRINVFAAVLAILAAGAITLMLFKLPKPAAAQQSIDPGIVATQLQQMRDQEALP